jgi:hypothetical protein
MNTTLHIHPSKYIYELQQEFNTAYPFLKLHFYLPGPIAAGQHGKPVDKSFLLKTAGLKNEGEIDISGTVTVANLERSMRDQFGLRAQVLRNSGNIWLETTMTDEWTLRQQNEHGREITHGNTPEEQMPGDYDLERDDR